LIVNKLIIFNFVVMLFLSGCASTSLLEKVEIEGFEISLDKQKCLLAVDNKSLKIQMTSMCHFVKNSNTSTIRVKYYDDIDSHVLLIVGTSSPKNPEYPLTIKRNDCGSQLQALIIKKTGSSLSSKILSNTLTCAGIGVDEKDFYILSH